MKPPNRAVPDYDQPCPECRATERERIFHRHRLSPCLPCAVRMNKRCEFTRRNVNAILKAIEPPPTEP